MRANATEAERLLWNHLRNRALVGSKWRQQYPAGGYILDFYCAEANLVIELDGSQHDDPEHRAQDEVRTLHLEGRDLRVLRFRNGEVMTETHLVLDRIAEHLKDI